MFNIEIRRETSSDDSIIPRGGRKVIVGFLAMSSQSSHAFVKDKSGGTDYLVVVNYLEHRRKIKDNYLAVASNADEDGWHDKKDEVSTRDINCGGWTLDAKVLRNWRKSSGSASSDWIFSEDVGC